MTQVVRDGVARGLIAGLYVIVITLVGITLGLTFRVWNLEAEITRVEAEWKDALMPIKRDAEFMEKYRTAAIEAFDNVEKDVRHLREHILETDPRFSLAILDLTLDRLSRKPPGSEGITDGTWRIYDISDHFSPMVYQAWKAGATKAQLDARINELVALAEKGKFLCKRSERLYLEGGAQGIRSYLEPHPEEVAEVK